MIKNIEIEDAYKRVENHILYEMINSELHNPPDVIDAQQVHVTITYDHGYAATGTYRHVNLIHG